jgi:hypothetical protein
MLKFMLDQIKIIQHLFQEFFYRCCSFKRDKVLILLGEGTEGKTENIVYKDVFYSSTCYDLTFHTAGRRPDKKPRHQ